AGNRVESQVQELVGAEAVPPGQDHGALEHVGIPERRPRVADGVGAGERRDSGRAQASQRRHRTIARAMRHDGNALLHEHLEELPQLDLVDHAEAEHVADRHLAREADGARALDDQANLKRAEGARVVEMDVYARSVAGGDPEDDVEVALGIAVQPRGIDAADQIGTVLHRAIEKLGGAGPVDDAALGKGHDLDGQDVLEPLADGAHGFEVAEADLRVDVGVVPDVERAAADRLARQPLHLNVDGEPELATEAPLVLDALEHGGPGLVRVPRQAPEGLVEMDVPVDEGGQEEAALPVDHENTRGRLEAGGESLDDAATGEEVHDGAGHRPHVPEEEIADHD